MRLVIAKRSSRRGEGLGNELLPWAKGWIASQELNAHLVGPSWGLNRRRYWLNFNTTRLDFVAEDLLMQLPHRCFTETDYRATGEIDFGAAITMWAEAQGLTECSCVVAVEGMWGGYASIRRARPLLWMKLLGSRSALRNVDRVLTRLDPRKLHVAVHIRSGCGEFARPAGESLRGRFNIPIPDDWYLWVCRELTREFRDRIQFWFFTDRPHAGFDVAVRLFNPGQPAHTGLTECSDLLLMALADLRVCSVSSYSMAACFLADGPYIWYEPQLTLCKGLYSMWGNEPAQQLPSSPTLRSAEFVAGRQGSPLDFPGSAMDVGDPLPAPLLNLLEQRLRGKDRRTNLLEYGCLPAYLRSDKHSPIAREGVSA